MVKRGYHVMAVPKKGLENIRLSSFRSLNSEDFDVLKIGYLGVEVRRPRAQKQIRTKSQVKNDLTEQVIDYVPTQALQQICTEYSDLRSDSESSLMQDIQPEFSHHKGTVQNAPPENDYEKPIEVSLPKRAINPLHWFQLDDTGSDCTSLGSASIDTTWSESSKEELSESVLKRYSYAGFFSSEERLTDTDSKELPDALETPFIDMDDAAVHYDCERTLNTATCTDLSHPIEDNRLRIMKVQTMTDLNNENHYAKRQNAESLNSILSNVFENDLAGKGRYKDNNITSSGNFSNGISEGNLSSLNKLGRTKRTNSDDTVLDMQKYVIQKENMFTYNKNNYSMKSWNMKCFDCKTVKTNSKLDSSTSSPESVTPYPLDDLYKKRQNAPTKTSANVVSLILCGCVRRKTKITKKFRTASKCSKKIGGRIPTVGFTLRK